MEHNMKKKQKSFGFSLIEIVVVIGILCLLLAGAFYVGLPQYDNYLLSSERRFLTEAFLESRARSFVHNTPFVVGIWSSGYCIQDALFVCTTPSHILPANMTLQSFKFATSTKIILHGSIQSTEINLDQYGFVDGQ
jgi:prepilin-type N-terminal cleavage/methylation domain-containing protein